MIPRILVALFLVFITISCSSTKNSQDELEENQTAFAGKIVYQYTFNDPESGQDITDQMADILGYKQHYFINSNNYKSYDEKGNLGQLYNAIDNKYYFPNPRTDEIVVIDASLQMSEIISITHSEETELVLGKVCKKVVVKTETDETTYFYSDEIAVDPSAFESHKFGGWNAYLNATNGSLALKMIIKNQNYIWTSVAVEIEPFDLTYDDFNPQEILN